MNTRREFLRHCCALAATMALVPLSALANSTCLVMKDISLDELSYATLARELNTVFRVYATPTQVWQLELVEANPAPQRPQPAGQQCGQAAKHERFSLIFRGAKEEQLEQKIHKFEHDRIGRFEMFIVPVVSRDTSRMYYEAVFDRPLKT
jgi:hypothetical protein